MVFYPPETFDGEVNPFHADIWALGITMYMTCCMGLPYEGTKASDFIKQMKSKSLSLSNLRAKHVDPIIKKMIARCLHFNPESRP